MDGEIGPSLFPVWGLVLSRQAKFRSHSKLPNVIEKTVAREDWATLRWFNELASQHAEALDSNGRSAEFAAPKDCVAGKLGDSCAPDEALVNSQLRLGAADST